MTELTTKTLVERNGCKQTHKRWWRIYWVSKFRMYVQDVPLQVSFHFSRVRALQTVKLRIFSAFIFLMSIQSLFPLVHFRAAQTR